MKFADPKNDIAFKKIFGDEHKKEILISFLNAVLDFKDEKEIKDVEILNPYQVPKIEDLKETILDIRATDKSNHQFVVEMQKNDKGDFHKRSLYYTSKAYVNQLESGENYNLLKSVYFIGILNFNIFENENYISRHLILDKLTQKQELKDFDFTFIELTKFNKELHELNSIADKWIYFLKNANRLDLVPKEFEEIQEFKEAFEIANSYSWSKKELEIYDYVRLKEMDKVNELETATKKGIQQGIEIGEKQKAIEIAKNLLKQNIDINIISISTGLSVEEIQAIQSPATTHP
ncbi:MAG: Rpn family recombination-promoting nuclease/putative transposase, partial [Epsilonproteobacteria bacterium]|nr:Rpn family recombination-promoting nuclease/putative transposase [Campylobacterota bacterium]